MIAAQVHDKFKVFVSDEGIPDQQATDQFAQQIEAFTAGGKISPKSLGIEYIEASKRMVLSLGYRDEPGYTAKLTAISLGVLALSPEAVETAMNQAAGHVDNVICHEFYVTETGEFVMVLLSHGK